MCKFCEKFEFSRVGIRIDFDNKPTLYFAGGSGISPMDERFRFCPMCGQQIIYKFKDN